MICYKEFNRVEDAKRCIVTEIAQDKELNIVLGNAINCVVIRLKNGNYTIANLWQGVANNAVIYA